MTFTNATGCQSNSVTEAISDPNPPTAPTITPSGPVTFCVGEQVTLTSSYTSGNNWSNGSSANAITVNTSGSYSVTYTDGTGCSSTSTPINITVNSNPTPPTITPSGSTIFCEGESVILSSSQGSGNLWSDGSTSQTISVSTSGSYSVTYTNTNGCSSTSSVISVIVNNTPSVDAGVDQSVCAGNSVTLAGSGANSYAWDNGVVDNQSFTPSTSATYTVIGTDANGCVNSDQVFVEVFDLPTVTVTNLDSICLGDEVFDLAMGDPIGGTYSGTGVQNNSFDPNQSGLGTFPIIYDYTDNNGCSAQGQGNITVIDCGAGLDNESQNFDIYPNPMYNELEIQFEGEFSATLFDMNGKMVISLKGSNKLIIDVSGLDSAVYYIVVSDMVEREERMKLIKR